MNFTILLHIIGSLKFNLTFELTSNHNQDFFIFDGLNSSAHLYRDNETIYLYLYNNNEFELYQTTILNKIQFSWVDFKVNGTAMKKVKSTKTTDMNDLEQFTFLSPLLDFQPYIVMDPSLSNINQTVKENEIMHSLKLKEINYGYIAGIILIFAIALELKIKIPLIITKFFGKEIEDEFEESDYESMTNIETAV